MTRALLAFLLLLSPSTTPSSTRTGDIRVHEQFHSRYLENSRRLWVYLPPGYEKSSDRYPVLYMHDGQNLFDAATSFAGEWHADETAERLILAGEISPVIIVGIDNTRARIDEYTPTRDDKYSAGGSAPLYTRFLLEEVKPFIDQTYRTLPDREHTSIAGSSLGGLVSLYASFKYPAAFGQVALLSPSLWWDHTHLLDEVAHDPAFLKHSRFYLDLGTAEDDAQSNPRHLANARRLADLFRGQGLVENKDFMYREIAGAHHNEAAWAERFPDLLKFFFPPVAAR